MGLYEISLIASFRHDVKINFVLHYCFRQPKHNMGFLHIQKS